MPTVSPSPLGVKPQFMLSTGTPALGNKLFFYVAGSVNTKLSTYTNSTGSVANTNPLVLNALGEPATEIWFASGVSYKVVYAPSTDTDPPTSPIWTIDNLSTNDAVLNADQWIPASLTPTFLSTTSFSLPGDQTSTFQIGRRVKTSNSSGDIYSTITNSVFSTVTTVTVANDSGVLDSGLSSVSYGILSKTNDSMPRGIFPTNADIQKQTPISFTTAGTSTAFTGTVTPALTALTSGIVLFATAHTAAGASPTLAVNGLSALPLKYYDNNAALQPVNGLKMPSGWKFRVYCDGTNWVMLDVPPSAVALTGFKNGLIMSPPGGSATMPISLGSATDSTGVDTMVLASGISKTTASWAVGTGVGGLDTGTIANNTWYHFYLIKRTDTGVVDMVFSTNATSPTMPTSYTEYRRIGSDKTDGSGNWVKMSQVGNMFLWDVAVKDVDVTNPGTSAVLRTLNTPLGINTIAILSCGTLPSANNFGLAVSSPDVSDQQAQAPATGAVTGFSSVSGLGAGWTFSQEQVRTNTSSQIRTRINASGAGDGVCIITRGWIDPVESYGSGVDLSLRAQLAAPTGADLVGDNNGQTGGKNTTVGDELAEVLRVNGFTGVDPTGATDSTAGIAAAIAAAKASGIENLEFNGTYLLTGAAGADGTLNGMLVPYISPNSNVPRVKFTGRATFKANSNNMIILRWSDSHSGFNVAPSAFKFDANGKTGVTGIGVMPESATQTVNLVFQIYNEFKGYYIFNCAEGIVTHTGPKVGGFDSGCWYNEFDGKIYSCDRSIWLKNSVNSSGSNNANIFRGTIGHGTANTGIQIDSGGSNKIYCDIEGIATGATPSAVPTGVKIANLDAFGIANEYNQLLFNRTEGITRELDNSSPRTILLPGLWRTSTWGGGNVKPITPYSDDPSLIPVSRHEYEYGEGVTGYASAYVGMKKPIADLGFPPTSSTIALGSTTNITGVAGSIPIKYKSLNNIVFVEFSAVFQATVAGTRLTFALPISPSADYTTVTTNNPWYAFWVEDGTGTRKSVEGGWTSSGLLYINAPSGGWNTAGNNNTITITVQYLR